MSRNSHDGAKLDLSPDDLRLYRIAYRNALKDYETRPRELLNLDREAFAHEVAMSAVRWPRNYLRDKKGNSI